MNIIHSKEQLLEFIRSEIVKGKNLSIRGVARCCDVDHKSIINSGDFKSTKLSQMLTGQGFYAGDLVENGFPPQAVWLCIEYFAYESKAEAKLAKQLARTFGSIGIRETFDQLTKQQQPQLPQRDATDYSLTAERIEKVNNLTLQELLRDELIDELSVKQGKKNLSCY